MLAATTALLEGELMGTELGSSASTTLFMWHMPTLFQEVLRGVIDSVDGLVLVPSSMGKAVVRDAVGKRLRTSKVDPDLVLRIDVPNPPPPSSSRCSETLLPSGAW